MAHDEAPESGLAVEYLNWKPASDNTPTLKLSGALFVSGGGLWYEGYGGTYTLVGAT